MQVKHAFTSGLADGPDATLVRPSNWNADHTLVGWDALTADKTVTVGSSGCDYTTLEDAFNAYKAVWIPHGVTLTFSLAAEIFTLTQAPIVQNPTFDNAKIVGATPISLSITSVASSSGSAGAWSYVLNVASTVGLAVGQLVCVKAVTGGSNPNRLLGCHRITAIGSGQITVSVLTKSTSQASGAVTATATVLTTVLYTTTNSCILLWVQGRLGGGRPSPSSAPIKGVDNIGFSTTGTTGVIPILVTQGYLGVCGGTVGIYGPFYIGMQVSDGGQAIVTGSACNLYVSGGVYAGLYAGNSGTLLAWGVDSSGSVVVTGALNGAAVDGRSHLNIGGNAAGQGAILSGNTTNAYAWAMSLIRRYNNKVSEAVTTENSPTANATGNNLNSFIESS